MPSLTNFKATSLTPQTVVLVVDDSNSMQGPADGSKSKSQVAAESIQDMLSTTQANNQGSKGFRFLVNVAKFGDAVTPIAEAQAPEDVYLDTLVFKGDSGWTNMSLALEWAASALEKSLERCRHLPVFEESKAPAPLVIFLSDGENNGPELGDAAARLRDVKFLGGRVSVIACGIGMKPEHFDVMKQIASSDEMAVNIKPSRLAEFIAAVGATMRNPQINPAGDIAKKFEIEQPRKEVRTQPASNGPGPQVATPPPPPRVVPPPPPRLVSPPPPPPPRLVPPPPPPPPRLDVAVAPPPRVEEQLVTQREEDKAPAEPTKFDRPNEQSSRIETEEPKATELVQEPAKPQAAPVQDEWDSQMALGRTALQTGRYPDAEAAFRAALDKVRTAADARLASTLASLADLYAIEGNWEKAVPFATGSLDLLEKLGPSTALNDGLGAAERVAELLSIAEKEPDAANLWARIANLWSGPGQGLPSRAGALTALGFVRRSQGNVVGACQAFQQALQMGGVGAVAALRGMTATKRETEGREAAQPYLEQLVSEVVNRFGAADVLAKKAIADLRLSYVLGSQREKLAQLERQYKPK